MYKPSKISDVLGSFQDYMRAERGFSPKTVRGYNEALRVFIKITGDLDLEAIRLQHFVTFKTRMAERVFSQKTFRGYNEALRVFIKITGDLDLEAIRLQHFVTFKTPVILM